MSADLPHGDDGAANLPVAAPEGAGGDGAGAELDPRLLSMLVCPLTRGPLRYDREAGELVSVKAGLAYRIVDGIPIMLPDEARILET